MQLAEYARQFLIRHMEQAGVGEDAVEMPGRQLQFEEALPPHLAAAVGTRHDDELGAAIEADGFVAQAAEGAQVGAPARSRNRGCARASALDMPQQRSDVLTHVMVARAFAKSSALLWSVGQGQGADLREFVGAERHGGVPA